MRTKAPTIDAKQPNESFVTEDITQDRSIINIDSNIVNLVGK